MIQIYTASAGSNEPSAAGWSFIVTEEVKITGETVIQYSGCTEASKDTALAMAILQALYWVREHKPGAFVITTQEPSVVNNRLLHSRIEDMHPKPGNIIKLEQEDDISELCASLADKALHKIIYEPHALFDDDKVDVGANLIKKQSLFSQSYVVMMKSLTTRTLTLQNMTTVSKRTEIYSKKEFDSDNFIIM